MSADTAREVAKAEDDMARAAKRLTLTVAEGARGAEGAYADAYQRLAALGAVQPLRAKYRGAR